MKKRIKKINILTFFIFGSIFFYSCGAEINEHIIAEEEVENISRIVLIQKESNPAFSYITDLSINSYNPNWSPNKEYFAFISEKNNSKDLWISDNKGINLRILNNNLGDVEDYHWSPNSKEIAIEFEYQNNSSNIYLYNLESENLLPITRSDKKASLGSWSPDNKWIVYTIENSIYVSNPKGVNEIYITEGQKPFWSPNGEYILYSRINNEINSLYIFEDVDKILKNVGNQKDEMEMKKNNVKKIHTNESINIIEAEWAFGGNKILYVSDSSGNNEIYMHEIRNKKNSRLTNNEVDEKNISWSERNKSIIFTSNAHGRADIYKMKGDGSNQEIILNSNENFKRLDW